VTPPVAAHSPASRGQGSRWGVFTFTDGTKYEGECNADKMHGKRVGTWPNGRKHTGRREYLTRMAAEDRRYEADLDKGFVPTTLRHILVSKTWRQGDFEVFDFEVEGLHNFYVRGGGSDTAGVLVHNSPPSAHSLPNFDDFAPGQGFSGAFEPSTGRVSMRPSSADPNVTPPGFASRNGGHLDAGADLVPGGRAGASAAGERGQLQGFTGFLEEGGGLRLEYSSGGLNGRNPAYPGRTLPDDLQGPLREGVEAATGRSTR